MPPHEPAYPRRDTIPIEAVLERFARMAAGTDTACVRACLA